KAPAYRGLCSTRSTVWQAGWRYVAEELAMAGVQAHLAGPADTAAARGRKKRAKTDKAELEADAGSPAAGPAPRMLDSALRAEENRSAPPSQQVSARPVTGPAPYRLSASAFAPLRRRAVPASCARRASSPASVTSGIRRYSPTC